MSLRVAIVHYHLRRSGVTRVIERAVQSLELTHGHDCLVLTGESPHESVALRAHIVPGLNYSRPHGTLAPQDLQEALKREALSAFDSLPDLWHFHNHGLGKNHLLAEAVRGLAEENQRLLLQIHDFAEDGRPNDYANIFTKRSLYPAMPGVHYAALNQRDFNFLLTAGIPPNQLHRLPNPICTVLPDPSGAPLSENHHPLLFYPARGIRRKNLGEMLLLAMLSPKEIRWAAAAAPDNPQWLAVHDGWKLIARQLSIPTWLGVAEQLSPSRLNINSEATCDFDTWRNSANGFLTTSVAEGFGLAFLEPFARGKSLIGRDLPEITADFIESGGVLPDLYRSISIPLSWIGKDHVRCHLASSLKRTYALYNRRLPQGAVDQAFDAIQTSPNRIDFGRLNEPMQEQVLNELNRNPHYRKEVRVDFPTHSLSAEDWLLDRLKNPHDRPEMVLNQKVIERDYSLPAYGERLASIYKSIMDDASVTQGDPSERAALLLDQFLTPSRFNLLRADV